MLASSPSQVTPLLSAIQQSNTPAGAQVLELVTAELRKIASRLMRAEKSGHVLQPTALVNELYLHLLDTGNQDWKNRGHFLSVAAQVMRRILVDHARETLTKKRGGTWRRVDLEHPQLRDSSDPHLLLAIDQTLNRLAERDPRACQVVEMRYFGGYSEEEIAEVLQVSSRTVKRDWRMARAWLLAELSSQ